MSASYTAKINIWVQTIQFRTPTNGQLSLYNDQLTAGSSEQSVQTSIINEGFTQSAVNPIIRLYQAAFNRMPDKSGLSGWVNTLAPTLNIYGDSYAREYFKIANSFADASEFQTIYGANASSPPTQSLITQFYTNILKRSPSASEVNSWLASGLPVGTILGQFAYSAEFIFNSTYVANNFSQAEIDGTVPSNPYTPLWAFTSPIPYNGTTYNLTTSADNIPGTALNDTINGVVTTGAASTTTLNVFDTINGAGGTNTLNANYAGTTATFAASAIPTLTNIQIVNLLGVEGNTLSTMDASIAPQITTLGFGAPIGFSGAGGFGVDNTQEALNTYNISNIARDDYDFSFISATGVHAGSADTATLNLNAVKGSDSVASHGPIINFEGAAGGLGYENVTINATGRNILSVVAAEDDFISTLKKVTITGAGSVTIDTPLSFEETAGIGTISAGTMTGNADVAVETDIITATFGSGDDIIRFANAGDLTSADSINLGTGTNTLVIADTVISSSTTALNSAINAITTAQILGFSANATVDASQVTINKFASFSDVNLTITKLATTDTVIVKQAGGTRAIDLTASLGFNTANIAYIAEDGVASSSALLNLTGQATINIQSTSDSTSLTNLTGVIANSSNAVFNITGNGNIDLGDAVGGDALGASAVVDGSALTGRLTAIGANGASILKGGSNTDTLTAGTLAGGDQLVGGAGNDKLNSALQTSAGAQTQFTGGTGADIVKLGLLGAAATATAKLTVSAADSYATAGQFDTVIYSESITGKNWTTTVASGVLNSTVTAATSVSIGSTVVAAGSWLWVNSGGVTTATAANSTLYQDSNSNGVIDSTDLQVAFSLASAGSDTLAVTLVGGQAVVAFVGVT